MRKVTRRCRAAGCDELPYLGGLCERHHKEDKATARRRNDAIQLLHLSIIDSEPLRNSELREELTKLQSWWSRACLALQSQRPDPVLQDEADYVIEWCISLAQEIVDAERSARTGNLATAPNLEITRQWVWKRLANLERGLMSNGVCRH